MSTNFDEYFGKVFKVPVYNQTFKSIPVSKFKIGTNVSWLVESKRKNSKPPFKAQGKIVKLYVTTFGSRLKKQAAKIEVSGKYLEVFPGRKHTTVAVDKLSPAV